MALTIKENNGTFLVEGTINATAVKQFKNHLAFLLLYTKALTIDINGVTAIHKNGLKAIEELFSIALICNKKFDVIGYGCKGIYDSIELEYAA